MQGTALGMSCSCYSTFLSSSSCNLEAMGRSGKECIEAVSTEMGTMKWCISEGRLIALTQSIQEKCEDQQV